MRNILTLSTLVIVLAFSGCKDDEEFSKRQTDITKLTAVAWGNPIVQHGTDGDLSDQYENFAIVFALTFNDGYDGTFVVSNGGYAFPENAGKWRLSEDLNRIIFDNGREFDVEIEAKTLKMDFTVAPSGGRVAGLSGHFTFDLQPL
ncbi:MAG: hypothetical protein JNM57_05560 [Cyclobacteriaceae bacterium]|nr:hypothetical protein [Cyclobacteriaceae bacterium]